MTCGLRVPLKFVSTHGDPDLWKDLLKCNIFAIPVGYTLYVEGATMTQQGFTNVYVDLRNDTATEGPVLCQNSSAIRATPIAGKTDVKCNCPAAKLEKCRHLYQPMHSCSSYWKDIPDDTISIYSWALFLLLRIDCKFSGIDFERIRKVIDCVASIDASCPVNVDTQNRNSNHYGQFFQQISAIQPLKSGFNNYFPALSTVEAQLINYPMLFLDFLNQLDKFIPQSLIEKIDERVWFDAFFKIVSDESDKGQVITMDELLTFGDWRYGRELILKWNQTLYELSGENPDSRYKEPGNTIYEFKKLVEKADHLKSIARQFNAPNPFNMFHEVFHTIFSKLDSTSNVSSSCAIGYVYSEPKHVKEADEFEVTAVISNVLETESLQNVRLNLEIVPVEGSKNAHIQYRLGPVFYSGISARDETINFLPGSKLVVKWRAVPVMNSRLIDEVEQQPIVNLYYEKNGQRLAQKLNSPIFKLIPKKTLRIFAFAYPAVFSPQNRGPSRPYTLLLSFMNTGYTTLKNVQMLEMSPWILVANDTGRNSDYKVNWIKVDDRKIGNNPYFEIRKIDSGQAVNMEMDISTLKEVGLFKNVSVSVKIGDELPAHVDFRFFLIHQALSSQTLVISDAMLPFQLYYYETWTSKIVALQHIQLLDKKQEDRKASGKPYRSVLAAYRRIPTEGKAYRGPAMGSLTYGGLPEGFKLIRASELLPGVGVQQRVLNLNDVWVVQDRNETTSINFIDLQASSTSKQLIYEFIFGNPNDFTSPYFLQNFYRIQLRPETWPEPNTILGTIAAVSPTDTKLNYTMVSQENIPYFQVNPKNGKIVLTQLLPKNATELCFNIITTDEQGQKTAVPVAINTGGRRGLCQVYEPGSSVYQHLFEGDTTGMKEMSQSWMENMLKTTTIERNDLTSTQPVSTSTPEEVSLQPNPSETDQTHDFRLTPSTIYPFEIPGATTLPSPLTIEPQTGSSPTPSDAASPEQTLETFQATTPIEASVSNEPEEVRTTSEIGALVELTRPSSLGETPAEVSADTDRTTRVVWPTRPVQPSRTLEPSYPTSDGSLGPSGTWQPSRASSETFPWISRPDDGTLPPVGTSETSPDFGIQTEAEERSREATDMVTTISYVFGRTYPTTKKEVRIEKMTLSPKGQAGFTTISVGQEVQVTTEVSTMASLATVEERQTSPLIRTPPPTLGPVISYTEGSTERSDTGVRTIILTVHPTTQQPVLPIATRLTLIPTIPTSPPSKLGGGVLPGIYTQPSQQSGESHYSSVIDMACRLKDTKPIWGVVCDMAKTVHFKAM